MDNSIITVDSTHWSVSHVQSFTDVALFLAHHTTSEHSDEHLRLVYELVKGEEKPKGKTK